MADDDDLVGDRPHNERRGYDEQLALIAREIKGMRVQLERMGKAVLGDGTMESPGLVMRMTMMERDFKSLKEERDEEKKKAEQDERDALQARSRASWSVVAGVGVAVITSVISMILQLGK